MKFIELFGMPGTGKTYLIENLRKLNKIERKNSLISFKKRTIISFSIKFFNVLIALPFIIKNFSLRLLFSFFLEEYRPNKSAFISIRTFSIIFNSIFLISKILNQEKNQKKEKIYVDQGFMQILFSILHDMDLKNPYKERTIIEKWFEILKSLNTKIKIYYLDSSLENISKRLNNRNGDSIIEHEEVIKENLFKYKIIFDIILKFLKKESNSDSNIIVEFIEIDKLEKYDLFHKLINI